VLETLCENSKVVRHSLAYPCKNGSWETSP